MLESDILYAYVKHDDWLKSVAVRLVSRIQKGDFGTVYTSREVLHELYYVSMEEGVAVEEFLSRAAALTAIKNLRFLDTTYEIDLLALALMKQYDLTSIFDAYYAATAANQVDDHTIISTDSVYDRIPAVRRRDPKTI
jgi:predicted nucleic acid-binding protein